MTKHGSSCVIFNAEGAVLLGLRNDFRVWGLPGGGVDDGETFEQTAIRETLEETGYDVEIVRHVGDYRRPQHDLVQHAYVGRIIGGDPSQHDWEAVELRWSAPNALPRRCGPSIKIIVEDATANYPDAVQPDITFSITTRLKFRVLVSWRKMYQRLVRGSWSNQPTS